MTREDILNSPALIKRFCRDYNVSVATFHPIFFEQQLQTVAIHTPAYLEAFELFVSELSRFNAADDYFAYYNSVKDAAISFIQSSDEYREFCKKEFMPSKYPKRELYTPANHLADFISIDLKKANYSIMQMYCPNTFRSSWEEFITQFGASDYIAKSKYIRQVVFGACNPKKQIHAETALMANIANILEDEGIDIFSVGTDEILIYIDPSAPLSISEVSNILEHHTPELLSKLKIECFNLIKNDQGYEKFIVKANYATKCKSDFKCIDSDFYCQVIKYYYHLPLLDSDLVFDYKGTTAMFMHEIPNPFNSDLLGG